jgi:hypothetical protein
MKDKKQRRNTQQHYVPASYLAGFTPDSNRESQLFVYQRNSEKMFRSIPDEAAKRRNYYSVPLPDGSHDDRVDVMITALESQAMPSLRKIRARNYKLSTFERALLATFIGFQEVRTPWTRKMFHQIEEHTTTTTMHFAANQPGYLEQVFQQMKAEGNPADVTPDELRDALREGRIKAQALPHAGVDLVVSMGTFLGNFYTRMLWTVLRAGEGEFVTSDAPVVRRDPEFKGGLYGGGLSSPTAQMWFPLSKTTCLIISHDTDGENRFFQLLAAGRKQEAEAVQRTLPPIRERDAEKSLVDSVNHQTITNADRFVFSPFESADIAAKLQGESQNMRMVFSPPAPIKKSGQVTPRPASEAPPSEPK